MALGVEVGGAVLVPQIAVKVEYKMFFYLRNLKQSLLSPDTILHLDHLIHVKELHSSYTNKRNHCANIEGTKNLKTDGRTHCTAVSCLLAWGPARRSAWIEGRGEVTV